MAAASSNSSCVGVVEKYERLNWSVFTPGTLEWVVVHALFATVCVCGAVENVFVLAAIVRSARLRVNFRNYFILNLACSDLLLATLSTPTTLYMAVNMFWPFGALACSLVGSLQAANTFVSSLSLGAVALDRLVLVALPARCRGRHTDCRTLTFCMAFVWTVSCGLALPYFFAVSTQLAWTSERLHAMLRRCQLEPPRMCVERHWDRIPLLSRHAYTCAVFALQYIVPLTALTVAYCNIGTQMRRRLDSDPLRKLSEQRRAELLQRNRKLLLLLTALVAVFALCWLPFHLYSALIALGLLSFRYKPLVYCLLVGLSSACFNPLLYGLFNENYRVVFLEMLAPLFASCRRVASRRRARPPAPPEPDDVDASSSPRHGMTTHRADSDAAIELCPKD